LAADFRFNSDREPSEKTMCRLSIVPVFGLGILATTLAAQPPPRDDVFGDPLPAAARARIGTVRLRHGALAKDVRFVAHGRWLLSGSDDNTVRLWEPRTGREVHRFAGRWGCLAPNGKTLVTWGNGFHAWDLATGKELPWSAATFGETSPYDAVAAVTRDGKSIVVAGAAYHAGMPEDDGKLEVRTLDLATGKLRSQWLGPRFNGDMQRYIFPGGAAVGVSFAHHYEPDDNLRLYDAASGKLLASCQHFTNLQWSDDGTRLVTQAPQPEGAMHRMHLLVYDAGTGKERFRYQADAEMIAALSPNGATVAFLHRHENAGAKRIIRVADVAGGKVLHELACAAGSNPSLRFSANGAWLTAALDGGTIEVWDVAQGKRVHSMATSLGGFAWRAEVSPDGKFLAAADGNTPVVHLWSLETGKKVPDNTALDWGPIAMAFSRDGKKLATITSHGVACIWDAASGRQLQHLPTLAAEDGYYPFEQPQLVWAENGHLHMVAVAGSAWPPGADSKQAHTVHLVDLTTGKPLRAFGPLGELNHSWTVSADHRTLAALVSDRIVVWDIATGQERCRMPLSKSEAKLGVRDLDGFALAVAPSGTVLAICDRLQINDLSTRFGPLALRELASGKVRSEHWQHGQDRPEAFLTRDDGLANLVFTPDGAALALAARDGIVLWDVRRDREIRRFGGGDMDPRSAAFSPDGKLLAAIQHHGGVCLWDVATGTLLRRVANGTGRATSFCFASDSNSLAVAGSETTVIVWDLQALLAAPTAETASRKTLEALWIDLASGDALKAGKAMDRLRQAGPAATAWLKGRLKPIAPPDDYLLPKLLADLDSNEFGARERASQELERLGDLAVPALRQRLRSAPPLETARRVGQLLARLEGPTADTNVLRLLRAVEVLEDVGGHDAHAALERLTRGMPGHRVTDAARAALRRGKK
jgi:WD40 repeat protein